MQLLIKPLTDTAKELYENGFASFYDLFFGKDSKLEYKKHKRLEKKFCK